VRLAIRTRVTVSGRCAGRLRAASREDAALRALAGVAAARPDSARGAARAAALPGVLAAGRVGAAAAVAAAAATCGRA
jgi:hypothetical protein